MNNMINTFKASFSKSTKIALSLLFLAATIAPVMTNFATAADPVDMEGDVTVRNATQKDTAYANSVSIELDEIAQVQLWHHNLKAPDTAEAKNTVVRFDVPTEEGKTQTIRGVSKSDNGNTISDTATVKLTQERARVEYVPGTAKFKYNKGAADGKAECITGYEYPDESCFAVVSISDDVVTTGVNLDSYRGGPLKGCNAFHESVTIQLRSKIDVVQVNKFVRAAGGDSDDWVRKMNVKPGQKVEYLISFKNVGNSVLNNIVAADNLPLYHEYVDNTAMLRNGKYPSGVAITNDNAIFSGGVNVGDYAPGANGYVWFTALIKKNVYDKCGVYQIRNVAFVNPDETSPYYSTAEVNINNECEEEPEVTAVCEYAVASASVVKVGDEVTVTAKGTTTADADDNDEDEIDNYSFVLNDSKGGDSDDGTYTFIASNPGTYTVRATVNFNEYGSKTSEKCVVTVKVKDVKEPVYACEMLTATKVSENTYRFDADASASNGASISLYGYDFGDGSDMLITSDNTVEHTYATGEYTAVLIVEFDVNGSKVYETNSNCTAKISVDEEQEEPVFACDALTVSALDEHTYKFNVATTADNGASIRDYTYDFGDDTEVTLTDKSEVEHTYSEEGTYTVTVDVRFNVNGEVVTVDASGDCIKTIEFDEEVEKCPIDGKGHLPKDSPDCKEVKGVKKKKKLPSTGAGSIAGAFTALTAAGAVGHNLVARKRK